MVKKIGIIGCGAIGTGIARYINTKFRKDAKVFAISDIDSKKAETLSRKLSPKPIITGIDTLIKKCDFIIESASAKISAKVVEKALTHKKDALIMSTGGLLDNPALLEKARGKGCNIYIPSGAICGLDGLLAAKIGKIKSVRLTTRKPPKGLEGAPYLKGKDLKNIKKETLIFEGNTLDAVRHFPQNINVAATLSLMGIGPRRTQVRIITSPEYRKNIHEVEISGSFGKIFTRAENVPSEQNPKTSALAIYSALSKIKEVILQERR